MKLSAAIQRLTDFAKEKSATATVKKEDFVRLFQAAYVVLHQLKVHSDAIAAGLKKDEDGLDVDYIADRLSAMLDEGNS